ncbi:hypothetical protein GXW74_06680 [Roseomonas eburnea]|uniref:Uncharacterized protein n=1 Tax=Neoroseomonas eburnea TaxID=1346889 RepID=A0A9X9X8X9_9PROT|nr:hypothetical protein [Neoroseomonas eburnea]MBR0680165.1 hypothetical protein [Neoroseomonas eburnea]
MTRRVTIGTLRITGLAGAAPTRAEVEAAVRRALAQRVPEQARPGAWRVAQPAGATLDQAAGAAAQAAFGERR